MKQEATAATNAWVHGRRDVVADARNKKGRVVLIKEPSLLDRWKGRTGTLIREERGVKTGFSLARRHNKRRGFFT